MDCPDSEMYGLLEDIGVQEEAMAMSRRNIAWYSQASAEDQGLLLFYTEWLAEATRFFHESSAALAGLLKQ